MTPYEQKLVYIASPYSHENKDVMDYREDMVTAIASGLTERYGYAFFLPITQSAPMARFNSNLDGKFDTWADIDLFMVSQKADEMWVILLDGWKESKGVQAEIKCAIENDVPVKFFDPTEMRFV